MRYILCVSFRYKPYKKTCSIQIFSNNCMLDDFELQNKNVHLRYIELDESAIGNELIFKIYNNDNNYSNGFMTKWAKVKLHNIVLLPKALFDVDVMKLLSDLVLVQDGVSRLTVFLKSLFRTRLLTVDNIMLCTRLVFIIHVWLCA